jgi:hypothetical protein
MPILETFSQPFFVLALIGILIVGEIALFILVFRLLKNVNRIMHRQNTLFKGKGAKDLEAIMLQQAEDLVAMDKDIQELFGISNRIHRLALRSIHKVGMLRFNPFKEVGSNQSFSIALLDGKDSGAVISSLHTREGARVYAKPIVHGNSQSFPLTEEEKQAIHAAQQQNAGGKGQKVEREVPAA